MNSVCCVVACVALIVVAVSQSASGLQCYKCNDHNDSGPRCNDSVKAECAKDETECVTVTYEHGHLERYCADKCPAKDTKKDAEEVSCCSDDLCNSAVNIKTSAIMVFSLMVVLITNKMTSI